MAINESLSRHLKELDEVLRCPICFDFMRAPMILPNCSHNFCSLCIRRYFVHKEQCPICSRDASSSELKANQLMDTVILLYKNIRKPLSELPVNQQCACAHNGCTTSSPDFQTRSTSSQPAKCSKLSGKLSEKSDKDRSSPVPLQHQPISGKDERTSREKSLARKCSINTRRAIKRSSAALDSSSDSNSDSSDVEFVAEEIETRLKPSPALHRLNAAFPDSPAGSPKAKTVQSKLFTHVKSFSQTDSPVNKESASVLLPKRNIMSQPSDSPGPSTLSTSEKLPSAAGVPSPLLSPQRCSLPKKNQSTASASSTPVGEKVPCPVCGVPVLAQAVNRHLDLCLASSEKKAALRQDERRKSLPKLVYNLLPDKDIRKRLKELGLAAQGDRQALIKRHHEFTLFYNADCDSVAPKPMADLVKEFEAQRQQKLMSNTKPVDQPVLRFTKDAKIEDIEKAQKSYALQHKAQFKSLIEEARKRMQAVKQNQDKTSDVPQSESKRQKLDGEGTGAAGTDSELCPAVPGTSHDEMRGSGAEDEGIVAKESHDQRREEIETDPSCVQHSNLESIEEIGPEKEYGADSNSEQFDSVWTQQTEVSKPMTQQQIEVSKLVAQQQTEAGKPVTQQQTEVSKPVTQQQTEVSKPMAQQETDFASEVQNEADGKQNTDPHSKQVTCPDNKQQVDSVCTLVSKQETDTVSEVPSSPDNTQKSEVNDKQQTSPGNVQQTDSEGGHQAEQDSKQLNIVALGEDEMAETDAEFSKPPSGRRGRQSHQKKYKQQEKQRNATNVSATETESQPSEAKCEEAKVPVGNKRKRRQEARASEPKQESLEPCSSAVLTSEDVDLAEEMDQANAELEDFRVPPDCSRQAGKSLLKKKRKSGLVFKKCVRFINVKAHNMERFSESELSESPSPQVDTDSEGDESDEKVQSTLCSETSDGKGLLSTTEMKTPHHTDADKNMGADLDVVADEPQDGRVENPAKGKKKGRQSKKKTSHTVVKDSSQNIRDTVTATGVGLSCSGGTNSDVTCQPEPDSVVSASVSNSDDTADEDCFTQLADFASPKQPHGRGHKKRKPLHNKTGVVDENISDGVTFGNFTSTDFSDLPLQAPQKKSRKRKNIDTGNETNTPAEVENVESLSKLETELLSPADRVKTKQRWAKSKPKL